MSTRGQLDQIERQIRAAATTHVQAIARWWEKIPAAARADVAAAFAQLAGAVTALQKAMPSNVSPMQVQGPGMQLFALVKGYGNAPPIVAAVLKELIPDLAPLADVLGSP